MCRNRLPKKRILQFTVRESKAGRESRPAQFTAAPAGAGVRARKETGGEKTIRTQYLVEAQLELLLAGLTVDNRLVCRVMLWTGLRVGDVLALRQEQLARCFWITEQKTGKRRKVGLPDTLIRQIKTRAGGSPWAFPSPRNPQQPRTRQAVWSDINRTAKALRIKANAGTHSMRKDYAVDLMHKYGDLPKVQRALNHSNPTITALYALADQLVETYPERAQLFRRRR